MAQDGKGGERDGNLDDDRADRQEPDFALGLCVHRLPNAQGHGIDPDLLGKNASIAGPLVFQALPPGQHGRVCKNLDLCTNPLTHIKCGFTLCKLYVRNRGRYGGLRIRAGKH